MLIFTMCKRHRHVFKVALLKTVARKRCWKVFTLMMFSGPSNEWIHSDVMMRRIISCSLTLCPCFYRLNISHCKYDDHMFLI